MEFVEHIATPKLDGVVFYSPFHDPVDGILCITGHHIILSSRTEESQELWLLHHAVDHVEKKINGNSSNGQEGGSLILKCKDFRIVQIDIRTTKELINVYTSIEKLSNPERPDRLYPFFYRPMYNILEDGHTLFKPETEFAKLLASDEWRISNINKDYAVCPTYAASLVVPKSIDDETIIAAASFRDGGRFPLLSYRHDNGAILMRSSQPLLNNNNRRSRCDEKILNVILNPDSKGYIVDTRSANYTSQCKAKGGGTEPDGHYTNWKRLHKGLDKIANCSGALLDSLSKLIEACNDVNCSADKWMSRLEGSNWLTHVQTALNASCLVAQCLDQEGTSVLVHGASGLDSTLLVTSVVQVILNPDCRTVRGLQALVEREWLQAGHPFQLSQFGTFLGNCEADREALKLSKKTTSLWSYLNRPNILTSVLNPMYEPNKAPIWPSVAPVSLVLWSELYLRWVIDQTENKKAMVKIQNLISNDKDLRSKVIKLRRQLVELHKEYDAISAELDVIEDGNDEG